MEVAIDDLLKGATPLEEGVFLIEDEMKILDYLVDSHGVQMMKDFDNRPENTGIAIFFHNNNQKDLVMAFRTKHFDIKDKNGLIMLVILSLYRNSRAKENLIKQVRDAYSDNSTLRDEVIVQIENHMRRSIEFNA